MDPEHPVVKLCVEGVRAETEGDAERALELFTQAWEAAEDDYYACVAAHMLARYQTTAEETLRWNQEALRRARAVGDGRAEDGRAEAFYPSLLLNMGYSHEMLGNLEEARRFYGEAARRSECLPQDSYGETVRRGISSGLARTGPG